jgi:acetylornithine deacetylase/succinyl-diaminopimelate desuccinylase-like protein
LTLSAISGGYRGPGMKTVIPASASLKICIRLVPDQDPAEINRLFQEHIDRVTPPTVKVQVQTISASNPVLVDRSHRAMRTAAFAYRKGFGSWPVFLRSGGSISSANVFQKELGIPTVLMGFGSPDDHMHSPNEKFYLPNFSRGIETSIWYLAAAARLHHVPGGLGQKEWQSA